MEDAHHHCRVECSFDKGHLVQVRGDVSNAAFSQAASGIFELGHGIVHEYDFFVSSIEVYETAESAANVNDPLSCGREQLLQSDAFCEILIFASLPFPKCRPVAAAFIITEARQALVRTLVYQILSPVHNVSRETMFHVKHHADCQALYLGTKNAWKPV
jgi:hypothetical protein